MSDPKPYSLSDAQAMAAQHPDTFDAPSTAELAAVGEGTYVKIAIQFDPTRRISDADPEARREWERMVGKQRADNTNGERPWAQVVAKCGTADRPALRVKIENDLVYTAHHGLSYGDLIEIEPRHIYQIHSD